MKETERLEDLIIRLDKMIVGDNTNNGGGLPITLRVTCKGR
jgi:hypothetical protein